MVVVGTPHNRWVNSAQSMHSLVIVIKPKVIALR
jgi:hypothetical protein